ncbi:probable E3 ubiquitin-protein ligase HERC1 [Salmo trutta]|uniref:probable E3 ubiquitin-protein ligase HERC1 n=1 Tax=Salmo trutta TaxID=8032 RepID=UPI0011326F72|nr:probable E3 ubiquitin-protein ligase HERC1 [Salmo trutta]
MGGADAGLRVGGRCVHKQTGRHATLLGVVKEGSTSAKVQWDEAEITISFPTFWSPSDTPLYNLEPCEPLPFDVARFRGLTASLLLDLTYLTSIHEDAGKLSTRRHEKRHRSSGGHDTTTTTATTNDDINNKPSDTEQSHQHRVSPDPKDTTTTGTVTTTTTSDLRVSHSLDEVKAHSVPNSKSESEISSCALDTLHQGGGGPETLSPAPQTPQEGNRRKGHEGRGHDGSPSSGPVSLRSMRCSCPTSTWGP